MSALTLPISWISRLALFLLGWKIKSPPRDLPKNFVAIVGHHTSHWDLALGLLCYWAYRIPFGVLVKKEVFDVPMLGPLVRSLGGIPVDRENPGELVDRCAGALRDSGPRGLVLAPSGTRSRRPGWKMGFYAIARRAGCPVMLNYLDWKEREGGFGECVWLTGDVDADMARIRRFYADKAPRYPEKATPIQPLPRTAAATRGSAPQPAPAGLATLTTRAA